ncbi:hypothetical protein [Nonomuraea sp. NPDC005501]|uniref:hypothetical protein n=1 Tax=Nonomuraea sp. NPDC005501 TaxID=3156884 RepID=UPI0033A1F3AB
MAEDLLHDSDVHALLDEERRGGVPGVMDANVSDAGLFEDRLPALPVLGSFDGSAVLGGEHQVVVLPALPRFLALGVLDFAVSLELGEEFGRALESELALALALARISPVSMSMYDQRSPRASPWRMPSARATDQRVPFLLALATSRMRRASSRVSGSISVSAAVGASTRVATFRVTLSRRTATLSARESMRCTLRTVLVDRPLSSMVVYAVSRCSGASRFSRCRPRSGMIQWRVLER